MVIRDRAVCAATQGQANLGGDEGIGRQLTKEITQRVNQWERAGKSAHHRKTIATALQRILEGVSDIERLRPHHPPWTKLEEACVKKVFEYKCMPYLDLMHKVSEEQPVLLASFFSSGDERSSGDGDEGSDEETNASGTAQPKKPRPRPKCDSSGEEAVKRKVKKYSPLLMHVAFGAATQGQAILGAAGSRAQPTRRRRPWTR